MENNDNIFEERTPQDLPDEAAELLNANDCSAYFEEEIPVTEEPSHAEAAPAIAETAKSEPTARHTFWKRAAAIGLAAALIVGSCGITSAAVNRKWEQKTFLGSKALEQINRRIDSVQAKALSNSALTAADLAPEGTMNPRQVYASNAESVVSVSSSVKSTVSSFGQIGQGTSTGSGFIISSDGYVVTNYHVIENATETKIVLSTGDEYSAEVVGHDSINDVAVLKVDAHDLPAVTLGHSDDLYIGDMVVAIGNPLGSLTATLTVGYVSGKDRQISTDNRTTINMIQTDAAINAGNSGGPLFNMNGEVVGITTAKYSGSASSGASIEGIGFAIPIDDVMSIIGDLRDFGYVTGAYLGVTVTDTDSAAAAVYGLPTGAKVESVVEGGSADRAGVQEKDIIIGLGDYEVRSVSELTRTLRRFKANDQTVITVIRSGERKVLDITLDEKPKDLDVSTPLPVEESMPQNGNYEEWFKYFFGDGK